MFANKFSPRTAVTLAICLLIFVWVGVIGSLVILKPDFTTRTAIIAAGAVVTEILFYVCGAVFGIKLFKNLRDKLRFRRRA